MCLGLCFAICWKLNFKESFMEMVAFNKTLSNTNLLIENAVLSKLVVYYSFLCTIVNTYAYFVHSCM